MNSTGEAGYSLADLIRSRRTVHTFQPERPPYEIIRSAVETACWAPNHHLTQPWRFHHLGPETIRMVVDLNARLVTESKGTAAGEAKRLRWSEVPGWLVVTCEKSADGIRHQEDFAACCCAIQNLSLCLWEQGIGVKWTTGAVTRHADFYQALGLHSDQQLVVGLLWYGYPAGIPEQSRHPVDHVLQCLP